MKIIKIFLMLILMLSCLGSMTALSSDGLVSWYKLYDNASDSTGFKNGTNNGVDFSSGGFGDFDGSDYIELDTLDSFFNTGTSQTVTLRFKADSTGLTNLYASRGIEGSVSIRFNAGNLEVGAYDGSSIVALTSFSDTSSWHFVAATIDYNNEICICLDGNFTSCTNIGSASSLPTSKGADVGQNTADNRRYNGEMRDVSIWDKVLNNTEVLQLYNNGNNFTYENLTQGDNLEVNILNITANNVLFLNNTNFTVSNIDFNVTYEVNNSDIGNFTNSSITNIVNATNGLYYIQFEVCYNTTCDNSINYTYRVNVTTPEISFDSIELNDDSNFNNTIILVNTLGFNVSVLNISTNDDINMTYTINGGSPVQFATNSLNSSFTLFGVTDGEYNISFYAFNNETNITSGTYYYNVSVPQYITFDKITLNGVEAFNNTELSISTLNFIVNTTNVSTSGDVNMTYSINGAAAVQFATNNINGAFTLNSVADGAYNISFTAFNSDVSNSTGVYYYNVSVPPPPVINTTTDIRAYYSSGNITIRMNTGQFNIVSSRNFTDIRGMDFGYEFGWRIYGDQYSANEYCIRQGFDTYTNYTNKTSTSTVLWQTIKYINNDWLETYAAYNNTIENVTCANFDSVNDYNISYSLNGGIYNLIHQKSNIANVSIGYSNAQPEGVYIDDSYNYVWGASPTDKSVHRYNSDWSFDQSIDLSAQITSTNFVRAMNKLNNTFYVYSTSGIIYQYYNNWTYTGNSFDISALGALYYNFIYVDDSWYTIQSTDGTGDMFYQYYTNFTYTGNSYNISDQLTYSNGFTYLNGEWYVVRTSDKEIFKFNSDFVYLNRTYTPYYNFALFGLYNKLNMFYMTDRVNDDIILYNSIFNNPVLGIFPETKVLLNDLADGSYDISFLFNNSGNITIENHTFVIDTVNPSLTVTLPDDFKSYEINMTPYISYSDASGSEVCTVYLNNGNYTTSSIKLQPGTISLDCDNAYYNFTYSGTKSYLIEVIDGVSNINSTGTQFLFVPGGGAIYSPLTLVNPYQYFNFQYPNGTAISNFSFGGYDFTNTANISTYNDIIGLGLNSVEFIKTGFATENFSFTVNNDSRLNITFNVTESIIQLFIYDRETGNLLTGLSTVNLISTTGFNGTTTTGKLNISDINFVSELYQIIVSHADYGAETIYFNYDNQELITKNIYLLATNSTNKGTITLRAEADTGQFIEGAICSAAEWRSNVSGYVKVAEGLTDPNGNTVLNIELNIKQYKFTCSKGDATTTSDGLIITTDATVLPIILQVGVTAPPDQLGGISGSVTNSSINATHQLVTYEWYDSNNLDNTGLLSVYKVVGTTRTLIGTVQTASSNPGILYVIVDINQTYTIVVEGSVIMPDGSIVVIDSVTYKPLADISFSLAQYSLDILIPLLFVVIGISLGLVLKPQNIFISAMFVIILVWLSIIIVPTVLSATVASFVTVMCVLMIWGGQKRG